MLSNKSTVCGRYIPRGKSLEKSCTRFHDHVIFFDFLIFFWFFDSFLIFFWFSWFFFDFLIFLIIWFFYDFFDFLIFFWFFCDFCDFFCDFMIYLWLFFLWFFFDFLWFFCDYFFDFLIYSTYLAAREVVQQSTLAMLRQAASASVPRRRSCLCFAPSKYYLLWWHIGEYRGICAGAANGQAEGKGSGSLGHRLRIFTYIEIRRLNWW